MYNILSIGRVSCVGDALFLSKKPCKSDTWFFMVLVAVPHVNQLSL